MSAKFKLLYSETCRDQIRALSPTVKPLVKAKLEQIAATPFLGKFLEKDLSGYLSFRAKRYRIIYKIREKERVIEIYHVGHRRDIYELFGEQIRKQSREK
jgi:mRNA-degrading endonuclease RelE of RelBE toxin-antitoxin system